MSKRSYNIVAPSADPDCFAMQPPVEMPAHEVPCACKCSWVVVTGWPQTCVLRLKRRSALCSYRHEPAGSA